MSVVRIDEQMKKDASFEEVVEAPRRRTIFWSHRTRRLLRLA
jgi:hypothetical protein